MPPEADVKFRSQTRRAASRAFANRDTNSDIVTEVFEFLVATHVWLSDAHSQATPDKLAGLHGGHGTTQWANFSRLPESRLRAAFADTG